MKLKEKFCLDSEKAKEDNKDKIALTDEGYVLAEQIEELNEVLEKLRLNIK